MPYIFIKSASKRLSDTKCCLITEGICGFHKPVTCIKAEYQALCCDVRVAFPLDSKSQPCLFTILGWTCCLDYEFVACTEIIVDEEKLLMCCMKLHLMKDKLAEAKAKAKAGTSENL